MQSTSKTAESLKILARIHSGEVKLQDLSREEAIEIFGMTVPELLEARTRIAATMEIEAKSQGLA